MTTGRELASSSPRSQADTLRRQFAVNATDDELAYFAHVFRHLEVDPWAGHICLVPYGYGANRVHRPQLTVAGRRFIAQRTGRLRGIVGPQWCGPRQVSEGGEILPLEWRDLWDEDGYPYAARCLVTVADWDHQVNGTVKWDEFSQWTTDDRTKAKKLTHAWEAMPSHMLGKVAESLALRRGFSEVQAAVSYLGDDEDATLVREAEATPALEATAETVPPTVAGAGLAAVPPTAGRPARRKRRAGFDDVPDWVRDQDPENLR